MPGTVLSTANMLFHLTLMREALVLSLVCKWVNWGKERLNILSKVTQLASELDSDGKSWPQSVHSKPLRSVSSHKGGGEPWQVVETGGEWLGNVASGCSLRCSSSLCIASTWFSNNPFCALYQSLTHMPGSPALHMPAPQLILFPSLEDAHLLCWLPELKSFLKSEPIFAAKMYLTKTILAGIF